MGMLFKRSHSLIRLNLKLRDIIAQTDHRSWPAPAGAWIYYQEWNKAVFIHFRVDKDWLQQQLPQGFVLETFDGDAWVSIVPFRMQKIRPRFLPHLNAVSDFSEINIRTYVTFDDKPGVFFMSIGANKKLSCYLAKTISGLPYKYEPYVFDDKHLATSWLSFDFEVGEEIKEKSAFDIWVTERYCLYYNYKSSVFRYNIHHLPWPLYKVSLSNIQLTHPLLGEVFRPESFHYSPGVRVLAWRAEVVDMLTG